MVKKPLLDSWALFKNNILGITLIVLPILAPIEIFIAIYEYNFIGFSVYPVYAAGTVFYVASIVSGQRINIKTALKLGLKYWFPYLLLSIIVGLLSSFGFVLLIIPGIIILVRYAFAEFELLLKGQSLLNSMRSSWDDTKQYMWVILRGYIIITLSLYFSYYFSYYSFQSIFEDQTSVLYWSLCILVDVIYAIFTMLYVIFAFRIYSFSQEQT